MANQRIINCTSYCTATEIMALIENLLREEKKQEAFVAIYELVKYRIERYEIEAERTRRRLSPLDHPSEN